jgi:small-conductance mechanosensitive channel
MLLTQVTPPINIEELSNRFETSSLTASDLLVAGIAVVAGIVLGAITRVSTRRLLVGVVGLKPPTAVVIARLLGYIVILLGVVIALSAVGLQFGPVITILLLVALTAFLIGRPLLSDLGAGLVLQSRRPISVDDVVRFAGYEGVVEDIDGRVVAFRTYDGWSVRVRNSQVLDDAIVKVADRDRLRIEFTVGVHYDTDLDQAVDVAARALRSTSGVLGDPAPSALIDEFDDSTINVRCWAWVDPVNRWQTKDVAMRSVRTALAHAGIEIAYPQRVIHTA